MDESLAEVLRRKHEAELELARVAMAPPPPVIEKPGPTLFVQSLRAEKNNSPANRLLDQVAPDAGQKIKDAPFRQSGEISVLTPDPEPVPAREERPTRKELKHVPALEPEGMPTIKVRHIHHTNDPNLFQRRKPSQENEQILAIETSRPDTARTAEPLPHERLLAVWSPQPAEMLNALAKTRQETRQEMDKAIGPEKGLFRYGEHSSDFPPIGPNGSDQPSPLRPEQRKPDRSPTDPQEAKPGKTTDFVDDMLAEAKRRRLIQPERAPPSKSYENER